LKCIDFAPIAILESIRMFLAFASFKNFQVYQMDIKSTFLNGYLEEEVCIEHLEGFLLSKNEYCVSILRKAQYGLKKDPRLWY
jgi:hypothetical protein